MDIMDIGAVTANYANPIVFCLWRFCHCIGIRARATSQTNSPFHFKITGTKANGIVLGFMLATAPDEHGFQYSQYGGDASHCTFGHSLLIDDADGFTKRIKILPLHHVGHCRRSQYWGMATLIGTPPNSVMLAFINDQFQLDIDSCNGC